MNQSNLASLLSELNFRVTVEQLAGLDQACLCSFLEQEKEARALHRLTRLLAASGMRKPQIRTFEQFDWKFSAKLPREKLLAFRASPWCTTAANLVLIGDAGIGKTHLAKALCYDAIHHGFSAYFITAFDLLSKIKNARSCSAKIDYYGRAVHVLCIDELGYTVYQKEDTDILFQIISKRCELLPTIVTTNLTPKNWGSILSGPAASTILDRLSSNGSFITWEGPSHRARGKQLS